jgi:drug/metabolite transporter (DMT)-like permease
MPRPIAVLLLVICTVLWGLAFVFQKGAMSHMGPLTFSAIRYIIGAVLLVPFARLELRRRYPTGTRFTSRQWRLFAALAASFFLGVYFQQVALQTTSVTNGGFLTSLYVIVTPMVGFAMARIRPHPIVYLGAPLALIGIYLLTGANLQNLTPGDGLLLLGAVAWAVQIAVLAPLVAETGLPVTISAAVFLAVGSLAAIGAAAVEPIIPSGIAAGWIEILYTSVMSTAIAFTLQAIGQQYVPPANAAIILSAESLFAALGGALLLGERLPPLGYAGAAIIFIAILLVELVPQLRRPTSQPAG